MSDENFLILDVERRSDGMLLWWRPNGCGCTLRLDDAGRYSRAQIERNPSYYNNGSRTLAVPESVAIALAVPVVQATVCNNEAIGFAAAKTFSECLAKAAQGVTPS